MSIVISTLKELRTLNKREDFRYSKTQIYTYTVSRTEKTAGKINFICRLLIYILQML